MTLDISGRNLYRRAAWTGIILEKLPPLLNELGSFGACSLNWPKVRLRRRALRASSMADVSPCDRVLKATPASVMTRRTVGL